jgi:hypothetical protein
MEEEDEREMSNSSGSWSDTSLAKGIGWVFAIIGVLATVAGVAFTVYVFSKEPTTILSATYSEGKFFIPDKLDGKEHIDSVLAERDARLTSVYRALKSHLNPREAFLLPDSLRPYGFKQLLNSRGPVSEFAGNYHYFYVLNIKNEGDKTLDKLHLIHGAEAYYEFKDSSGLLRKGHSAGNLPLGDLAATESREVHLWTPYQPLLPSSGLTVTYDAGKVKAKPVTVNGTAIESQSSGFPLTQFISYFFLGVAVIFLFQLFKSVFTRRS